MRSAVVLSAIGGLAVVLVGAGVASLKQPTPDDNARPGLLAPWTPAPAKRSAALNDEIRAVDDRVRTKRTIATGLIRGETTIERAVARFRDVLDEEPMVKARLRDTFAGASDDELALRQLNTFVRMVAPPDSERVAAVLRDLDGRVDAAERATRRKSIPVPGASEPAVRRTVGI